MTDTWMGPVPLPASRTPATLAGLWSLLQTAAVVTTELAVLPGLDDDLSLASTCADLQQAARELKWAHPYCAGTGIALDVGTAPLDDVHGCRTAILALVSAAFRTALGLDGQPDLSISDLLTIVRLVPLLRAASNRLTNDVQHS